VSWISLYARSHGRALRMPGWLSARVDRLEVRLYLFLINRLYLDAASRAINRIVMDAARRLDQGRLFLAAFVIAAVVPLFSIAGSASRLAPPDILWLLVAVIGLPLFPFHGPYIAALTRLSGYWSGYLPIGLAVLVPAAGLYALLHVAPQLPPDFWHGAGALALLGALYGTLKALAQFRVRRLIAHAGLVFYSIFWWHLSAVDGYTPQAAVYVRAVILVTGGLLIGWHAVQARYGNLDMDRIGGLARAMPRFALWFSLLVMAAVGLPPFGLFFGFVDLLLHSGISSLSGDLLFILLAWFGASFYLFKMLQRLLFGPPREELRYHDLRATEVASFALLLVALLGLSLASIGSNVTTAPSAQPSRTAMIASPTDGPPTDGLR